MTRQILWRTSSDSQRVPWRNGRGVTEQLAIWPEGSSFERGDFDWRISKARVEESGPFSHFAGFERILLVTEGAGLVLSLGESAPRSRLRPLEPYRFAGEWPTRADLVAGPVADFNVLTRRGVVSADAQVSRIGARRMWESMGPGHAFVHVLAGSATVRAPREEEPFELAPAESVWARELGSEEEFEIAGGSPATLVVILRIRAESRAPFTG
ncbi:MAG: HutD family protein [Planctomycetota bacterium]|nr:HutD family protein [Planctomycetota bacterium]